MNAADRAERDLIAELTSEVGRRLGSLELRQIVLRLFVDHFAQDEPNTTGQMLLRMALKASPYADNVTDLLSAYREVTRQRVARELPDLAEWVAAVETLQLPLPVVLSCDAYLDKARDTARALTDRYFGVQAVIVAGGDELAFDRDENGAVLRLPVGDRYEDLPAKVFESWTLFEALGAGHGVLKIDDDTRVRPDIPADIDEVRAVFAEGDYMGVAITDQLHDRCWHYGKCTAPLSAFYAKPFLAPWIRGALYYLSKPALAGLTAHYLRFPGCIAGELYEDKAIGDVLHTLGIPALHFALEPLFGLDTDAPERGLAMAD